MIIVLSLFQQSVLQQTGVTLKQAPGSILPAMVLTAILVAAVVGLEVLSADGTDTSTERLLYQATMPGLDEEPFYRGLFLYALSAALISGRWNMLGAPIGWAGVLITIIFGLGHSLMYSEGAIAMSWIAFIYTGILGFGLLWLRERTGSLVMPIVAHNLINFSSSFF